MMRVKTITSFVASIIRLFIIILLLSVNSKAVENNIKYYSNDLGILSLMYHRFNENKYPSTNIQMSVFKEQIEMIKKSKYEFYNPSKLEQDFKVPKKDKKILLTIDDAFTSFYEVAWPYLKKNKIPFILFVSTEPIGNNGYMDWSQIKEVERESFAYIGHHSHSHDYLVNLSKENFKNDIDTASKIFKENLGYNPVFFSYPFGEYNSYIKRYISKDFKIAFGQHSGVIDINKDQLELPRFPINEKYGDLERFKFLIDLYPLEYKKLLPTEKYLNEKNNPPVFSVEFFDNQKNIKNINCFSDEGDEWEKSNTNINDNTLTIKFREKFNFRRGRINCSLNDNGTWRWFGTQFSIKQD